MPCKHEGGTNPCDRSPCGRCRVANSMRNKIWDMANREKRREYGKKQRCKTPLAIMLRSALRRAKQKGLAFDLREHTAELQNRLDAGVCELTGCCFNRAEPGHQCRPSLDRKDSAKGYTYDNVRLTTVMANKAMNEYGQRSLMRLGANLIEKEGGRVEVPKDEFTKGNR